MVNNSFYAEISTERKRQDDKWGKQDHAPQVWLMVLAEEFGEIARAILEDDHEGYERELIQLAAVAKSAYDSFYRNERADDSPLVNAAEIYNAGTPGGDAALVKANGGGSPLE